MILGKTVLFRLSIEAEIEEWCPHILMNVLNQLLTVDWSGQSGVQADGAWGEELQTLLPWQQIYSGNCDGVARHEGVSEQN